MLSIWKKETMVPEDTGLLLRPMQSGQKGSLENMHRELRYILPNEVDLPPAVSA